MCCIALRAKTARISVRSDPFPNTPCNTRATRCWQREYAPARTKGRKPASPPDALLNIAGCKPSGEAQDSPAAHKAARLIVFLGREEAGCHLAARRVTKRHQGAVISLHRLSAGSKDPTRLPLRQLIMTVYR